MGFDTTIIINNDMLSEIESDASFGRMVAQAIRALPGSDGPVPIGNGAYVIESHHMDGIVVVAVGGRKGKVLGSCAYTENHQEILHVLAQKHGLTLVDNDHLAELNKKPDLAEIREWADSKGYRLVKKVEEGPDDEELTRAEEKALDQAIEGLRGTTAIHAERRVIKQVDFSEAGQLRQQLVSEGMLLKEGEWDGPLPPLKTVQAMAKAHGWRCIVLRRKAAKNTEKKRKHG